MWRLSTGKKTEGQASHKADAFDRAAAWLAIRPRTEWEVRKYLKQKEYSQSEIDDAIKKLLEYRYVDDRQYCQSYIRMAAAKGKGRRRMENDLAARGIGRSVIEDAFSWIEESGEIKGEELNDHNARPDAVPLDEKKRALTVAVKMTRQQLESGKSLDEKYFARVARRLAGLGYTTDVIYFVIGKLRGIKRKR